MLLPFSSIGPRPFQSNAVKFRRRDAGLIKLPAKAGPLKRELNTKLSVLSYRLSGLIALTESHLRY